MRLFQVLGLALTLGLGVTMMPGDSLPGREVDAAESATVVGGACPGCYGATCGGGSCGTSTGVLPGGGGTVTPSGDACNSNCSIFASCVYCNAG